MKCFYMDKIALGSQELYQVLEELSLFHASGTGDRDNSSLTAAGEAVCDSPVVRKPNMGGTDLKPPEEVC